MDDAFRRRAKDPNQHAEIMNYRCWRVSGLDDVFPGLLDRVPRIHHQGCLPDNKVVVVTGVVGDDDHHVGPAKPGGRHGDGPEAHSQVLPVVQGLRNVRVIVLDPGALGLKEADDLQRRRFPLVIDVLFICDAQDHDPRAPEGFALGGQGLEGLVDVDRSVIPGNIHNQAFPQPVLSPGPRTGRDSVLIELQPLPRFAHPADDPAGIADDKGVIRNVLGNDRPRPDEGEAADDMTADDRRIGA